MMDLQDQTGAEQAFAKSNWRKPETPPPDLLRRLVRRIGVRERQLDIRQALDLVCAESLRPDAGWSSLNADGTPVQFALSLIEGRRPAFEFIGEPFRAGMKYPARHAFGLERMKRLSEAMGVNLELDAVRRLLEELTDGGTAGDCEDPSGAFWLGMAFESAGSSWMNIYANGRRGPEASRWTRLLKFAESVAEGEWPKIFAVAETGTLKPLGAGVRITRHGRPHARVYFGAYGVRPDDYRRMFREAGAPELFDRALVAFFEEILGTDSTFPTQSAVFSFGTNGGGEWAPKLELCGHCAWNGDREAETRCGAWLERLGADADLYRDLIRILESDQAQLGSSRLHAYIGVGMRHDEPYASIYLNPGPGGL